MAITTAICNSYKKERDEGAHNLSSHTLKLALIKSSPTGAYGEATTNYSDLTGNSDEATGTGYTAGGKTLTNVVLSVDGSTRCITFDNVEWTASTFSVRGALLYNASAGNKAIAVFDFGETKAPTNSTFRLRVPLAIATLSILRSA